MSLVSNTTMSTAFSVQGWAPVPVGSIPGHLDRAKMLAGAKLFWEAGKLGMKALLAHPAGSELRDITRYSGTVCSLVSVQACYYFAEMFDPVEAGWDLTFANAWVENYDFSRMHAKIMKNPCGCHIDMFLHFGAMPGYGIARFGDVRSAVELMRKYIAVLQVLEMLGRHE